MISVVTADTVSADRLSADRLSVVTEPEPDAETGTAAGPAPRPGPVRAVRTRVQRLARQSARLERRRHRLDRLARIVDELGRSRLVAVAGEAQLVKDLSRAVGEAERLIHELAAATGRASLDLLDQLDRVLSDPLWDVERTTTDRLVGQRVVVNHEIARLVAALAASKAQVNESWIALDQARAYGVVDTEQQARTSAVENLVTQAEKDTPLGRFDTVAVALAHIAQIGPIPADDNVLVERVARARERLGEVVRHAELVLIRSEGAEGVLEYTALLRIPRSDLQRVDLAASSVLVVQDRAALTGIIHDVARVVDANVRSSRSAKSPSLLPGAADLAPPTRGFADDPEQAELTATDLTGELRDVGQLMYTLFLPDEMQRLLGDARASLIVTTNDLELPWELLHDGRDFLCIQRPVARMPLGRSLPRRPHHTPVMSGGKTLRVLLVASDPNGNLPGAAAEVLSVANRLSAAYGAAVDITRLTPKQATGAALNDHLRSGAFHVIHYAGHAAFDPQRPERSRLLLQGDRPGTVEPYFAQKIERILEGAPLVFLNACESSVTNNEQDKNTSAYFAKETQGLASAFLYGGAMACVGSLWPVFDDTAAELAATFYERLFEGLTVGEALRQAREHVRGRPSDRVTWAAYALYGDPSYVLPLHPRALAHHAGSST